MKSAESAEKNTPPRICVNQRNLRKKTPPQNLRESAESADKTPTQNLRKSAQSADEKLSEVSEICGYFSSRSHSAYGNGLSFASDEVMHVSESSIVDEFESLVEELSDGLGFMGI